MTPVVKTDLDIVNHTERRISEYGFGYKLPIGAASVKVQFANLRGGRIHPVIIIYSQGNVEQCIL